ncbi:MAG: hypothetical protein HY868_00910 [Chloroflexi bacterium]|nr:hypothetical protein [Chloroflexota bacterium]
MNHILLSSSFLFLGLTIALTACATIVPTPTRQPIDPTANAPIIVPTRAANTPAATPSFDPKPGDDKLQRGNVFLDTSRLLSTASFPPLLFLELTGSLPTPCHQLRVQVSPPNAKNEIHVSVYSLADPSAICVQMIAPFSASVPLKNLSPGKYTIWVNEKQIGELTVP